MFDSLCNLQTVVRNLRFLGLERGLKEPKVTLEIGLGSLNPRQNSYISQLILGR